MVGSRTFCQKVVKLSNYLEQQKRNIRNGGGVEYGNANVPVNMFVAKRNISGKVDILLAVFLGEYNNASQFFRMEIS